ncbi:hypothetical protein [Mesorhizobium sp. M0898]|uniref:hypothetical protein n=1 Tax=Mesorhizobium sp. M0898 TaxID=2957020 RepID=UPI00333B83F6
MPLIKSPIVLGDGVWVCADTFVGPNVKIGAMAVVGARSVVVKDIPEWTVAAGHPAKKIAHREFYPKT